MESVLLSLAAGCLGIAGASLLGGLEFQFTSIETLSEITYGMHLSGRSVLVCIAAAALMGYAGGLLPAVRASAMPIVAAVRGD